MLTTVLDYEDVTLFIAAVVGLAAITDGHIVVVGGSLIVERTRNFGTLNTCGINFALVNTVARNNICVVNSFFTTGFY